MIDLRRLNHLRFRDEAFMEYIVGATDELFGTFWVKSPVDGAGLKVLASNGHGWDHVSVSRRNRPPNWPEMDHIKRLFFLPGEVAMQLHVAVEDHINNHPNVLHLWRPHHDSIPLPPKEFV